MSLSIVDAAEIRIRAERRIGELIAQQKATIGLASGREGKRKSLGSKREPRDRPTLADAGIDKKLSMRAQRLASLPERTFERRLATWRNDMEQRAERVSLAALRDVEPTHRRARTASDTSTSSRYRSPGSALYFRIVDVLDDEFDALSIDDRKFVLMMLDEMLAQLRATRLYALPPAGRQR